MIAGTLEIQMLTNMARISNDMTKAKGIVGDAVRSMEQILGALGVGFSAKVLLDKLSSVADGMAHLQDASEKTGASIENLSKLQFFAGVSGSSIDGVTSALAKLSKGMAVGGEDTGKVTQALKFLGLSAKDAAGNLKDPSVLFGEISQQLIKYQDGAGKAAIAQALFGKAGAEMLPTLKKMAELGDIEASVTKEQAAAAEAYQIEIARLNQQKEILWNTIASALLPTMKSFVDVLLDASKQIDSLGGVAKTLAADGSIQNWAEASAMGIARFVDVMKAALDTARALILSTQVVLDTMERPARHMALIAAWATPGSGVTKERGDKMWAEEEAAREQTVRDAYDAYFALYDKDKTEFSRSVEAKIAKNKEIATALAASRAAEEGLTSGKKPSLNFALGDATKAAAELKLYTSALQKLEEELGKANGMTTVEKTIYELTEGSLRKLTLGHKAEILAVAGEVDERKQLIEVIDAWEKDIKELEAQQEHRNEIIKNAHAAQVQQIDDIKFGTEMIGKESQLVTAGLLPKADELRLISAVNLEIQTANALRQIDLKLRQDILALGPEMNAATDAAIAQLEKQAAAQKAALPDALATQESARLMSALARNDAEEFKRLWTTVESTGKAAFVAVLGGGKNSMQALGAAIKASIIDLLYELTAKKWVVNIGLNMFQAMGLSTAGTSLSGASLLGNLGLGSGAASGLYGSFATSSIGQSLGLSTLTSGIEGAMDTAVLSRLGTAMPYIGVGLAVASALGLFSGGGGPKASSIGLVPSGPTGAGVHFTQSDVTDSAWGEAFDKQFVAAFNAMGPKGQAFLRSQIGKSWTAGGPDSAQNMVTQFVQPLLDQATAMDDATKAAMDLTAASTKLADAWQSVTDSIVAEIQKIKGQMLSPTAGLSYAQASFAIATAQTRAGDINAGRALPELAQAVIDAATTSASSALDLARIQARVLGSLEGTVGLAAGQYGLTVPSYAVGTEFVPFDQLAQVHRGESVITASENTSMSSEIKALRAEVAGMRRGTDKTANYIERAIIGDLSLQTTAI